MNRRKLLMVSGVSLVSTLAGCSGGDSAGSDGAGTTPTETATATESTETPTETESPPTSNDPEPVLEAIEYFGLNNIGSRMGGDEPFYRFNYRSEVPFQMETDVGGVLASRNHEEGIKLEIDLTEDDDYGDAHIQSGIRRLEDISRIQYRADEDLYVGLHLGTAYNDDSILKWEEVTDTRERGVGRDGDEPMVAGRLNGPSVTIERDDSIFFQPQSETTHSINELIDTYGNVPSRVLATLDGGNVSWTPDERERTAVVTEFEI